MIKLPKPGKVSPRLPRNRVCASDDEEKNSFIPLEVDFALNQDIVGTASAVIFFMVVAIIHRPNRRINSPLQYVQ